MGRDLLRLAVPNCARNALYLNAMWRVAAPYSGGGLPFAVLFIARLGRSSRLPSSKFLIKAYAASISRHSTSKNHRSTPNFDYSLQNTLPPRQSHATLLHVLLVTHPSVESFPSSQRPLCLCV